MVLDTDYGIRLNEIRFDHDLCSRISGLYPYMFTFFETRFDRYIPSELIICHSLEFGFEIKESIAHLTME
jgi:hypothetical protein